ncbi:MAG TPA: NINE protein [Flavobacterium sp.]|jgi:TM2 domain-containing membrane protein YozV
MNSVHENWNRPQPIPQNNKKVLAGILALLIGLTGIHKFILGYNKEGAIILIVSCIGIVTTCLIIGFIILGVMSVIVIVEGIIYLTKSDEEFYQMYQVEKKPWF